MICRQIARVSAGRHQSARSPPSTPPHASLAHANPSSYLSEWALLVQLLSHTAEKRFNVGSADKQSTKEAAAAFFDRLAELEVVCRQHPFSRQDPELRERIGTEVSDFVRQGYATFWSKAHSRGYDKYLRQTPDDLHRRVQNVFR